MTRPSDALITLLHGGASGALPSTTAVVPHSFGGLPVCLRSGGSAQVESVRVVNPRGGMRVADFAVRPFQPDGLGEEPRPLSQTGFGDATIVRERCRAHVTGDELAVEPRKPTDATAGGDGFEVTFTAEGKQGRFIIPFAVVLCEGSDLDAPSCRATPLRRGPSTLTTAPLTNPFTDRA